MTPIPALAHSSGSSSPRSLVLAAGSTLAAGALIAVAGRRLPLADPALMLLLVVGWWAARRGLSSGLVSAAAAVLASGVIAVSLGGSTGVMGIRFIAAAIAMPLAAWIAGAMPRRIAARVAPADDDSVSHSAQEADDQRRYRTLAEALPQLVWTATTDGRVDYLNQRGLDYTGLTLERIEGWGWEAAIHPDDWPQCVEKWMYAVQTETPYEVEYRILRASDGMYRWHLGRALPSRDASGTIVRWIGTCTDIHDRREAADAIRRWELVFRHSSWGVLVLGDDGVRITAANPAFERMHGRPEGSLQHASLLDVVAPDERDALATYLGRVQRDGRAVFESTHMRQDGTRFPVLVDMTEVRQADGTCYRMANYLDLSLMRAADAARETAEMRFRAVQDASLDAFVLWDIEPGPDGIRNGLLRYANPAANRLFKRDLHDELGRSMSELFPDMRDSSWFALCQQVYRTGVTGERTSLDAESGVWLRLVAVKIEDGIGVISTDVSAAKEAEAVLRRTRDELEDLVAERTRELHHARDLAVLANRAKSDFLSRASHELRTPLSSVIGFSNILLKNKQGSLAPDELTYLSRIARNGRNLLALVNDLLDLSKIEAGRVDLELSPVSLFDVLYEVQDTLEPRAAELGLKLRVDVEQENDLIIADETRLRQVLVNLAGNAIKYTRQGKVEIRVISNAVGAPSRIDVVDSGPGIPADRLDAIFQPFVVDAVPASGDAATGLGLAITRALCDLMGYRLTVESRVGHGSTFSVHLLSGEFTNAADRGSYIPAI